MDGSDTRVTFRPLVTQGAAAIGAAVVYHEDFQMRIGLTHNAFHALVQIVLHIIDGNDD